MINIVKIRKNNKNQIQFVDLKKTTLKRLESIQIKDIKERERELNIVAEAKEIGNIFLNPRDMEPPPPSNGYYG